MITYKGGTAIMLKLPANDPNIVELHDLVVGCTALHGKWKVVKPEDYHLTLQFVGRDLTPDEVAGSIVSAFTFANAHPGLKLNFPGSCRIQTTTKGRYLVAGIDADVTLRESRKYLQGVLADMDVKPKDSFEFKPHLTLAEAPPVTEGEDRRMLLTLGLPKPPVVKPFSVPCRGLTVKYGPNRMVVDMV